MKIEMNINEISSKVLLKVKSHLSYPHIDNCSKIFQNGLCGSLPGFVVNALIHSACMVQKQQ